MTKYRKPIAIAALVLMLGGCSAAKKESAVLKDEKTSDRILEQHGKAQPVPFFDYSQARQNLIEIATAQANTTQTTSFFFLEGIGLVGSCPSIGFPIASTTQLTNPGAEKGPRESRIVLPQIEPTGVYTGESTGTYTICVDGSGTPYASYFEGYVQTVTGPAEFVDGQVKLTGKPTGDFSKGKGK